MNFLSNPVIQQQLEPCGKSATIARETCNQCPGFKQWVPSWQSRLSNVLHVSREIKMHKSNRTNKFVHR